MVLSGQMGWLEESKMASLTCLASWDDQKVRFSRLHQPERHTHSLSSRQLQGDSEQLRVPRVRTPVSMVKDA